MSNLSEEQKQDQSDLVMIYSTPNKVYAMFLKESLEQSGISAYVISKGSFFEVGMGWKISGEYGYEVYVPKDKHQESLIIKEQTVGNL